MKYAQQWELEITEPDIIIENLYFIVLSLIIRPCWFTWINKEDLHCFGLERTGCFCYGYWLIHESWYCAYMSRSSTLWAIV